MELAARTGVWSGKTLPYLRRVAYLESHGTEYIDTGVKMNSLTDSIYIKYIAKKTTVEAIAGHAVPSGENRCIAFWNSYKCADLFNSTGEVDRYRAFVISPTINVVSEGFISSSLRYVSKNGVVESQNNVHYDQEWETDNIYLFWANGNWQQKSSIKLIESKIRRVDDDLFNAIPVLDLSGRPAMYDEVSGQFFYNQGTGEFTWGELDAASNAPSQLGGGITADA